MIKKSHLIAVFGSLALMLITTHLSASDPDRIKAWIDQLKKPTLQVRIQAAAKLGEFGNLGELANSTLESLSDCVVDPDSDLRVVSAYALGRIGADLERSVSLLCPLLVDPDEHVRYSAEWSIAEIARGIANRKINDEMAIKLLDLFRAIEKRMEQGTFQERHVLAVKLVRIRLESYSGNPEPVIPGPPLQKETIDNTTDISKQRSDIETNMLASISLYEANDIAGRLMLVDRMADESQFDDRLRLAVLKHELELQGSNVVSFALTRWQALGQRLIAQLFEQLVDEELKNVYGENVVRSMVPSETAQWESLCNHAENRSLSEDLRFAALHAVQSGLLKQHPTTDVLAKVFNCLIKMACDPKESESVRIEALSVITSAGQKAAYCAPSLITLLTRAQLSPELKTACSIALEAIDSNSREAASAVADFLRSIQVDDSQFPFVAEAMGGFGVHGVLGIQRLLDGLRADFVATRVVCAASLEKLGSNAAQAVPSLIALIVNPEETIELKNQAAAALKQIGQPAIAPLIAGLQNTDAKVREHVLRAMAIAANTSLEIIPHCIDRLSDIHEETSVRCAASTTLGRIGTPARSGLPALLAACEGSQPAELRSAALIAVSRIDHEQARKLFEANENDSEWLIRASVALGLHLTGQSAQSIDSLLELLEEDDSDRNELIYKSLIDLGPSAVPALLEIATDSDRTAIERIGCLEAIIANPPIPWPAIIRLLEDDEIGEQTAGMIEAADLYETEVSTLLIGWLRSEQLSAATRIRIVQVLEADGFGAVGEDDRWADTLALNQPAVSRIAAPSPKKKSAPKAMAAGSPPPPPAPTPAASMPPALPPPMPTASVLPPASELTTEEKTPDFVADGSNARNFRPTLKKGDDHRVAVFYGTNRFPIASQVKSSPITAVHVGLACLALALMFGCFFLFPRHSFVRYAIASLIGMGTFSTIALQAMLVMDWPGNTKEQPKYSGVYHDEIQYGVCEVSIPEGHQPGELESPQLFKLEVAMDPEKHIVLNHVERMPLDTFRAAMQSEMDRKGRNIFVFIHGYNVSFEDAARRTAQMAYDLKFAGAPVFYSWPSQAKWYSYVMDRENIQMSTSQIRAFLLDIAKTSNADTINLIAHSMGNVGLTAALSEIEQNSKPYFNQVVLAAPDIDADVFKNEIASKIVTKSRRTTLYTSKTDLALISSRYFNQRNRAGDSGPEVIVLDGIETIDATAVDSSLLGHSYYGSNVTVLDDLGMLLKNKPIETREYLKAIVRGKKPYWTFEPTRISKVQSVPIEVSR